MPFTIAAAFYPQYVMALNLAAGVSGVRVVSMAPMAEGCP